MTWTSAFGRACGVLLDAIVRWLALARINPNVLTFHGLVVNIIAAFLFGYANGDNQARMFRYAGLVIIGSGFFDLVDGRVARATNQVTRFGGFFDSVIDRYSDASQFFGLLVFYARGDRFFYVVLTRLRDDQRHHGQLHPGPRRIAYRFLPSRLHGAPGRLVLVIIGALFNRMAPVLWVIAVLSTITVIHRIRYTWTRTGLRPVPPKRGRRRRCGAGNFSPASETSVHVGSVRAFPVILIVPENAQGNRNTVV